MIVILISGKARHGKDTAASYMKELLESPKFNSKVLITHYADLVKFVCEKYFDWEGKKDENGRHLLQYVGTDIVRANDPDYWVRFVYDMAKMFSGKWDYMIIPDARFPNEISAFKAGEFDTIHIRIVRDGFDDGMTEEQRNHASETALDSYKPDMTILNNGTMQDLRNKVEEATEEIIWTHLHQS